MKFKTAILASAAFMVCAPASADVGGQVKQFASNVVAGNSLSDLQSQEDLTTKEREALAQLVGCKPTIADGSTKSYVTLDFVCEAQENLRAVTSVTLSFDGEELSSVSVFDESAFGPTDTAMKASDIPSAYSMLKKLEKAVRNGEDVSLAGLLPLNNAQETVLKSLSECEWDVKRTRYRPNPFALVLCESGDKKHKSVEIETDTEGRPELLRMESVVRVARPVR